MKTLDTLKEIEFADSSVIKTLYEYKVSGEMEQLEQANGVVREYHSGKLDPLNALKNERKRKKTMLLAPLKK